MVIADRCGRAEESAGQSEFEDLNRIGCKQTFLHHLSRLPREGARGQTADILRGEAAVNRNDSSCTSHLIVVTPCVRDIDATGAWAIFYAIASTRCLLREFTDRGESIMKHESASETAGCGH
jgi:hypothetical protein